MCLTNVVYHFLGMILILPSVTNLQPQCVVVILLCIVQIDEQEAVYNICKAHTVYPNHDGQTVEGITFCVLVQFTLSIPVQYSVWQVGVKIDGYLSENFEFLELVKINDCILSPVSVFLTFYIIF